MADYNYIYSSDDADSVQGTEGDDNIEVRGVHTTVTAYGGNDIVSLMGVSGNWTGGTDRFVYGGDGTDLVFIHSRNAVVYGEGGNDGFDIENAYAYVDGGEGNDIFDVNIQVYSTTPYDPVTITGGIGNDSLRIVSNHNFKGVYAGILFTDFSNDDAICVQDDYLYSETEHSILTQSVENGNVVIRDNSSIVSGDTVSVDPSFSITLQGVSDISQVADAKFYRYIEGNDPVTFGELFGTSATEDSAILSKNGDTYTYSGGNKTIENYQQGEVIELAGDYQGIDLNGNSFFVKSSSGSLEIQNSRDKFVSYSASGQIAAYSYVASGGGQVDGRSYSQAEIFIGADNADNQIYAGSGGSSLWGGVGGVDTLIGGSGYDEFFYAVGGGSDIMQNVGDNDLINLASINLSQISGVDVNVGQVNINFVDGGSLQINGGNDVRYQIAEGTFAVNQSTKEWSNK